MIDSTKPISVALVLSSSRVPTPAADPAIDRSDFASAVKAVRKYAVSRSDEDRAAIPLVAGGALTLFELAPLSMAAMRFCKDADKEAERYSRAFFCACRAYTLPGQPERKATMERSAAFPMADDAWAEEVGGLFGDAAIDELGSVAFLRARAPRGAVDPFVPPLGLAAR